MSTTNMPRYLYIDVQDAEKNIVFFHDVYLPSTFKLPGLPNFPKLEKMDSTSLFVNAFLMGFAALTYLGYRQREEERKTMMKLKHQCGVHLKNVFEGRKQRKHEHLPAQREELKEKEFVVDATTQTDEVCDSSSSTTSEEQSLSSDDDFETVDE